MTFSVQGMLWKFWPLKRFPVSQMLKTKFSFLPRYDQNKQVCFENQEMQRFLQGSRRISRRESLVGPRLHTMPMECKDNCRLFIIPQWCGVLSFVHKSESQSCSVIVSPAGQTQQDQRSVCELWIGFPNNTRLEVCMSIIVGVSNKMGLNLSTKQNHCIIFKWNIEEMFRKHKA